jgi:hypothetical protein
MLSWEKRTQRNAATNLRKKENAARDVHCRVPRKPRRKTKRKTRRKRNETFIGDDLRR